MIARITNALPLTSPPTTITIISDNTMINKKREKKKEHKYDAYNNYVIRIMIAVKTSNQMAGK